MKPKWQKLASLAQKFAHSSFISLVQSLLPKDTLLRTYLPVGFLLLRYSVLFTVESFSLLYLLVIS